MSATETLNPDGSIRIVGGYGNFANAAGSMRAGAGAVLAALAAAAGALLL